jgi:cell division protein FtsB
MNNDFIQNAVNNLYQANELMALKAENARLQAEVERLNTGIQPAGSNDAVGRAVNVLLEKEKEIARLKAEVADLKCTADRFKAEVEHLTSENLLVREESDRHYKLWVQRGYQLDKLRKLGTEMGKHLPDTDEANRAYIHFEAEGVE